MDPTTHDIIARRIAANARGTVRTAGKIEFVKDQGPVRRDIRVEGFEWSPDVLRNLAKILWAAQRAHSYAVSSLRLFSRMPASQCSPDGLLGGRGYIQSVKDMRSGLANAVEALSGFTDTLYDEINGEHWSSVETEDTKSIVEDTEEVKENPDGFVEEEFKGTDGAEGEEGEEFLSPDDMNPDPEDFQPEEDQGDEEDEDGQSATFGFTQQATRKPKPESVTVAPAPDGRNMTLDLRHASSASENFAAAFARMLDGHTRTASSSLPVSALPGPRVEHREPGATEFGWANGPDAAPSDDPSMSGFSSGSESLYDDVVNDGVTGEDVLRTAASRYSWLPGSNNDKQMPIYTPGLSEREIQWMVAHAAPDNPDAELPTRNSTAWIWDDV